MKTLLVHYKLKEAALTERLTGGRKTDSYTYAEKIQMSGW